jgi:death-on-curing protein
MVEPVWITESIVLVIHDDQIAVHGGSYGILNTVLLESALGRPRNLYAYDRADLFQMAAAYGYGIVKNHAFVDGNKRTAFQVMFVFLKVNGFDLDVPEPEVVLVMQNLAAGEMREEQLAKWLEKYSCPIV